MGRENTTVPLMWASKRQAVVTSSSTAAEYLAASMGAGIAIRIDQACKEIGLVKSFSMPILDVDSQPLLQGTRRGFAPYEPLYHCFNRSTRLRVCELADLEQRRKIKYVYVKTALRRPNQNIGSGCAKESQYRITILGKMSK